MTKINTVTKSRKPLTCRACHTDLPVGSSYTWVAHFRQPKMIHCSNCGWKQSELHGSPLQTQAWEAIEGMIANLRDWDGDDFHEVVSWAEDCEDALHEVAGEYEASCEAFENGAPEQLTELYEACDDAANNCDIGEHEPDDDDSIDDARENLISHFENLLNF